MSRLRAVLDAVESAEGALSVRQLADRLGADPGVVESMIDYWVRRGRLARQEVGHGCGTPAAAVGTAAGCHGCPIVSACQRGGARPVVRLVVPATVTSGKPPGVEGAATRPRHRAGPATWPAVPPAPRTRG